jgi:hypothetical protein
MIDATRTLRAATALSLFLIGATVLAATGTKTTPASGAGYGYGPGMMGPGGMYNWTPGQGRQHWRQMRQHGYGPGMMYNWTPQQHQQHWQQMHQYGYGPGMMGPGWGRGPGGWGGSGGAPRSGSQ